MKKLLAILMCATLLFSLAACKGGNTGGTADVSDKNTQATETTEPEKKELSRGTISGDVYTNEFSGFTFTKPAEWNYLSDEELMQLIDAGQEVLDFNALQETLSKTASVYDMSVSDAYGNGVIVCYENTMLTALRKLTVDEYIEAFKSQLQNVSDYTYEFISSEDVKLGDTEYRKLVCNITVNNVELTQAIYITVIDQYAISVTITSVTESVETIEAMFS